MIGTRVAQIFWTAEENLRLPPVCNPGSIPFTCASCGEWVSLFVKRNGHLMCETCVGSRA